MSTQPCNESPSLSSTTAAFVSSRFQNPHLCTSTMVSADEMQNSLIPRSAPEIDPGYIDHDQPSQEGRGVPCSGHQPTSFQAGEMGSKRSSSSQIEAPDWNSSLNAVLSQLQEIESKICGPESVKGKVRLRDIIQTSNELVPALKQLETTYNQRNDSLKELQGQYQQTTSQVAGTSKSSDSRNKELERELQQLKLAKADVDAQPRFASVCKPFHTIGALSV